MTGPLHPLVLGLLDMLPAPGTVWPEVERAKWLLAAETIMALIYDEPPNLSAGDPGGAT